MKRIKYPFPRTDITVKLSEEAWGLVHEACEELGVTVQDLTLFSILMFVDRSRVCIDWSVISDVLK